MPPAGEAGPPPRPSRVGRHRPVGWRCLQTTAIGGPAERRLRVNAVLLHPAHGIALIDLAPRSTPRAVATLRRSLAGQGLRACAGPEIPIVYLCVTPEELRSLPHLLRAAIIRQAEAAGRPDRRWVAEVEAALAALDRGTADAAPPGTGGRVLLLAALAAGGLFAALLGDALWAPRPPAPGLAGPAPAPFATALAPPVVIPAESGAAAVPPAPDAASPADPGAPGSPHAPHPSSLAPAPPPDTALAAVPSFGGATILRWPQPPDAPVPQPGPLPDAGATAPAGPVAPSGAAAMPDEAPATAPDTAGAPGRSPGPPAAGPAPPHLAAIAPEAAPPEPATAGRQRPSAAAPARPPASPRCGLLLARLQLGERPSDADRALLRSACAPAS
ncbi:hypothetical protein [Roseicella aerolata]|uniref:Uncharacterized protein n=1 Tax=Roseicella aerolata TaxID=2883479 RepID=A0A9X1L8K7_9PROT|nr:hypothetical protein [Roseicella aerolata]MCB4822609.1 hypothetical protein [Roseicella aerolata]